MGEKIMNIPCSMCGGIIEEDRVETSDKCLECFKTPSSLSNKEIKAILEVYTTLRMYLSADGEQEALDSVKRLIYIDNDNAKGANKDHIDLERFCGSVFDVLDTSDVIDDFIKILDNEKNNE